MDAQEREREAAANTFQGSEDMFLILVPHCPGLGPPRPHVGDVQVAGILSSGNTAFMGHQVHGDEPWPGRVPLSSSLDRDLPQEERLRCALVHEPIQDPRLLVRGCMEILSCLLYTSDAADDLLCVDLGGRRIIK